MRLLSVSRFVWLSVWRRMRLGICSQRRVVVGRMGEESSGCWRLEREGELEGWLSEIGRLSERFDSCLVVENSFNATSAA